MYVCMYVFIYLFCFEHKNTPNSEENKGTNPYKLELKRKLSTNIFKWQPVSSHGAVSV